MPQQTRICRQPDCGTSYIPTIHHPGNILDCPSCAVETHPAPRGMTYAINKHASEQVLVITHDRAQADDFARSQRRSGGQGVIKSIVARKS